MTPRDKWTLFTAICASSAVASFLIARRIFEGRYKANRQQACRERVCVVKCDPYDPRPRTEYLSWDDYFMAVAFLSAQRSKDPNKQVGACIVGADQIILGIGYNGFPRGCPDGKLPWAKLSRDGSKLGTKYPFVVHAEANAILNAKNTPTLAGATIYVTMFPCNECAKLIIQAGIREVVFFEDKQKTAKGSPTKGGIKPEEAYQASKQLLAMAKIVLRQHRLQLPLTLSEGNPRMLAMQASSMDTLTGLHCQQAE